MKIAISGAHGVGKTTLAKTLAKMLDLPLLKETAREVAQEYGFVNTEQIRGADNFMKSLFQNAVFTRQARKELMYQYGFVGDRSVIDCIAYSYLYGMPEYFLQALQKAALEHSNIYSLIVYCPISAASIEADGFRLVDKGSQEAIDRRIQTLLEEVECPVLRLSTNRDMWAREVLGALWEDELA